MKARQQLIDEGCKRLGLIGTTLFENDFKGSVRAENGVKLAMWFKRGETRAPITIDDALELTADEMLACPNMGKKSVREVLEWQAQYMPVSYLPLYKFPFYMCMGG